MSHLDNKEDDLAHMTSEQLEVAYGEDWYNRATWACPEGDFETSDIEQMYEFGGQCPVCGASMLINHIQPDNPF